MTFQKLVNDIKSLKIQGAQNVSKAGVKALLLVAKRYKNNPYIIKELKKAKETIFKTRPTEPGLRNSINYLMHQIEEEKETYKTIKKRAEEVKKHFQEAEEKIAMIGERKITDKSIVYTHCHSSTVMKILKMAKKKGKNFEVHNTETRPMLQGRKTAKELTKAGIPVVHYVDSAARLALKRADIMLIGADAITSEGKVINKIGSELFAEIANKYEIPVYVCTDSWKFDPKSIFGYEEEIEIRNPKEIWSKAPKGIKIDNHAFEKIDSDLITGIITELGVYRPEVFVQEIRRTYPWII